ncbi:MAG: hypothetical protein HZC02_01980 [Candidatus Levybacteria bacterium]|nr:hypothetical protein [Candidatus Levybacteria bacterium]
MANLAAQELASENTNGTLVSSRNRHVNSLDVLGQIARLEKIFPLWQGQTIPNINVQYG